MAILTRGNTGGSHWYTKTGEPMHTVLRSDGSGERATSLADARKLGLLPSVTNILGVLHKPQLETFKLTQAVRAAMASPKQESESEDYYIRRIIDQSKEQVVEAADLGTRIHAALDAALAGGEYAEDMAPYVEPAIAMLERAGWVTHSRESVLLNLAEGYAGRVDALYNARRRTFGVLDFKTRRTTLGKLIEPYDGQGEQLAAYAVAAYGRTRMPRATLANLYISTTEPGRVQLYLHDNNVQLWRQFVAACVIWRGVKGYDPRAA